MNDGPVDEADLPALRRLAEAASPAPWRAMIEGRDHVSGDSFVMGGSSADHCEDLYLDRDCGPASTADHDFVAAARNLVLPMLDEIDRLRAELGAMHDGIGAT